MKMFNKLLEELGLFKPKKKELRMCELCEIREIAWLSMKRCYDCVMDAFDTGLIEFREEGLIDAKEFESLRLKSIAKIKKEQKNNMEAKLKKLRKSLK